MAAIDQRGQLDPSGPSKRIDRVHGGANSAPGVENVIDNDDCSLFQRQGEFRRAHDWQFRARSDVVAVHRYVDDAGLDIDVFDPVDKSGDALRNLYSASANSSKYEYAERGVALDDFVGDR